MTDQTNPWDTTPAADSAAQSADAWGTASSAPTDGGSADWLTSAPAPAPEHFNIMDPFHKTLIPLDSWVTEGIDWMVSRFRPVFKGIRVPVDYILNGFQQLLLGMPAPVAIILFALIAWQISGVGMGVATLISLVAIGAIGAWSQAMITLALVLTALLFCVLIGLPMGIWLARSPRAAKIVRPLLDAMQTTPAFVYLVPIVMLFGIGNVPGVVVTIIFALPPIVRLTILGINQVPADLIEASRSFGASPRQMLFKVQLPLAMPTIMAGVNQTLMLALSMVVIASMIAVGGLGQMVLRGIGRRFSEEKPFKGLKVALSVHLEAKTAYLCRVMEMGGAEMYVTASNPLSTQDDVAAALAAAPGKERGAWRCSSPRRCFAAPNISRRNICANTASAPARAANSTRAVPRSSTRCVRDMSAM